MSETQLSAGYSKELSNGEIIEFEMPLTGSLTGSKEKHSIVINKVGENFVNLTIKSSPVYVILFIGQSIKLNLTSEKYYDLYLKLESIKSYKAEITVKSIHEEIYQKVEKNATGEELGNNETKEEAEKKTGEEEKKTSSEFLFGMIIMIMGIMLIIVFVIVGILWRAVRKKKKKISHELM